MSRADWPRCRPVCHAVWRDDDRERERPDRGAEQQRGQQGWSIDGRPANTMHANTKLWAYRGLLAAWLSSTLLFVMPDGSGPILPLGAELSGLQDAAAGQLGATLALDASERLRSCTRHLAGQIRGTETVAPPARNGSLFLIHSDDTVRRADRKADGSFEFAPHEVGHLGAGRAGGNKVVGERLFVADNLKGLVELDLRSRKVSLLTPRHSANDLDFDPTSDLRYPTIFFSQSSTYPIAPAFKDGSFDSYDAMDWYFRCALRGDATGGLFRYDSKNGTVTELLSGLYFANGVAVAADGSFVLVAESNAFRVQRVWLRGEKAGTVDTFAQGLPGFPDGISLSADGKSFWLAVVAPYTPFLKVTRFRFVRGVLARVRTLLEMLKRPLGLVLQLRASDGAMIAVYADKRGELVRGVTAVTEADGQLLLGSTEQDGVISCPIG